jgi:hypothetical protein
MNIKVSKIDIIDPDSFKGYVYFDENQYMSKKKSTKILTVYNTPWKYRYLNTNIYLFLQESESNEKWEGLIRLMFGRVAFMRLMARNKKNLNCSLLSEI